MNQFVTNTKNVIRGKYHPEFLQNEVLADIEILNKPLVIDFGTLEPSFEDDDY
ncbi:hypothetical protein [Acinetobacter baumannii]|uniref:hypothetical protein n=1 Tax=Acinetobacter baumannii TaxID=470 RepID=UPI0022EB594E|nr:hypothetical protein [Acinetobacter baumannii]MDA3536875.1 hypothetical protein [Acinetobacter baumannii]WOQ34803.1 hypothetical protein R3L13_06415 [Acinetobacter baumannii]